jgi:hypothetical protein
MNERIEKLGEQAGLWNDMEPTRQQGRYVGYMNVSDVEKFAELIVRQCIGMVLPYNEEDPCAERLYELADTIGDHFGVEE